MKYLLLFILLPAFILVNGQIIKQTIPDKTVILSFDDAPESQYAFVAPLLKKYDFGATFFVCEFPPNFGDTTKYMNWRQIKELYKMGFEIANHTRTHPSVSKLSKDEIRKELDYIENKCGSLHIQKPETFAYPGYSLSQTVMDVLLENGYEIARAGGSRVYDPQKDYPLLIPSWAMTGENKPQIMEALKQAHDGKIVVLTIHGVPDIEHPWVTTPPELFKEYVIFLAKNHYNVIAFRDLEKFINMKKALKEIKPDLTKPLKN